MERIFEQTLLYDFYGELLTPHQQEVFENAVYNDMSLSELAQEHGISRQGAHDLLRRCQKILQEYESKLHLVERFLNAREKAKEIEAMTRLEEASSLEEPGIPQRMERIRQLAEEIMKEF